MSLIEYVPAIVSAIATIAATIFSWILSARTTKQSMTEKNELDKKRDLVKITLPLEIEAYAKADAAHAAYMADIQSARWSVCHATAADRIGAATYGRTAARALPIILCPH